MNRFMVLTVFALTTAAQATPYKIDVDHSTVGFKISHLVGKVTGRFDKYDGVFTYDKAHPALWKAEATIDATSINTSNAKRDAHLNTPDFFDTKQFPTLKFVSTGISDVQGSKAKLTGNLTLHGVTKPVTLALEALGETKDPQGVQHAGFEATGSISRKEFGIAPSMPAAVVGDTVDITLDVEGVEQK